MPAAAAYERAKSKKSTVLLKLFSLKSFGVKVSAVAGLTVNVADSVSTSNIPYNAFLCILISRLEERWMSEDNRITEVKSTFDEGQFHASESNVDSEFINDLTRLA